MWKKFDDYIYSYRHERDRHQTDRHADVQHRTTALAALVEASRGENRRNWKWKSRNIIKTGTSDILNHHPRAEVHRNEGHSRTRRICCRSSSSGRQSWDCHNNRLGLWQTRGQVERQSRRHYLARFKNFTMISETVQELSCWRSHTKKDEHHWKQSTSLRYRKQWKCGPKDKLDAYLPLQVLGARPWMLDGCWMRQRRWRRAVVTAWRGSVTSGRVAVQLGEIYRHLTDVQA